MREAESDARILRKLVIYLKIILKYIVTNISEHRARTAVMLLSVLLSSALLSVSFSIGASYESAQRKMARGMAGSAAVSVAPVNGAGSLTMDIIPESELIENRVGILRSTSFYHEDGYYETVDLIGADIKELNKINKPRLISGNEITDFSGNEVILPDRFTSKYGIEKGDTVTLWVDQTAYEFTVAEIAAYDTVFLRHTRGATALLPLSTLSGMMEYAGGGTVQSPGGIVGNEEQLPGRNVGIEEKSPDGNVGYTEILLEPAEGVTAAQLMDSLSALLPSGTITITEIVNEAQVAADARQKSMPFFLISFFSMTMSVFIIYSSYKVITLDRLPVIGTFRSIGAPLKTVTRILLFESLIYGVVGGLLGIFAGILALKLILSGMGQNLGQGIEIPLVLSIPGIVLAIFAAVAVSLLSAWLPVRRASRLPVKDVVLGFVEEKRMPRSRIMGIGLALFILCAVLPRFAPDRLLYFIGGLSLIGLIAAAIFMIPLVIRLFSKVMAPVYGHIWGNEGRLAVRNMQDNNNITQNVTLLFISLSAVIAISAVGGFVQNYITDVFQGAKLEGFADGSMDQMFIEQVKAMDGIEDVLALYVYKNGIQGNGITLSRMEATDDLQLYNDMFALNYTKSTMAEAAVSMFDTKRTVVLSEECLERTGLQVGDTLTLTDSYNQNDYVIGGSFKSRATDVEAVIASNFAVLDFPAKNYGFLAYTAADSEAIMIQLRNMFGEISNWSRTVEEFNSDALSTVGAFLKPMNSMTYFILLLAAVGVMNNLLINYIQRRRAIAMYRSIGMSLKQNTKITLLEGFSSGMVGSVIAIIVSYMEIQTIFLVAGPKISMTPKLNMASFIIAGICGIAINLAGAVIPVLKGRRMKLVEEIKFE